MKFGKSFFCLVLFLIFPIIAQAATPAVPSILEVNESKVLVLGVTPKNTEVVVYVDDNFLGLASVVPGEKESDSFNFSMFGLLPVGTHEVKVAAKDIKTRSLSKFSTGISFFVNEGNSNEPKISKEAVEEENVSTSTVSETTKEVTDANDKYLLDISDLSDESKNSETEKNKNILRWNLVIFILFLIAIISWIFWVNHELKKEREEQEKKE